MIPRLPRRASSAAWPLRPSLTPFITTRLKRYEAYDAQLDRDALAEARSWFQRFDASQLPRGNTTYARSSGPGGQHVNKTETKATTAFPVKELLTMLPGSLHPSVRASKYYTAGNDSLTFQAQTHRSRMANTDENREKLLDEVARMYRENTPAETGGEKKKKHQQVEKRFHECRIKDKKLLGSKKQSRRGPSD
ncbi:Peptidyl-tRNA hydrolase domain-containing protein [Tolypocladium capitatum]|uniref:Peptidyl-tRNA hydrolase domain-containing protein n=1 Tax=Tolypocladium capitatum TaxID=45235 RepID=A0A2K3Q7D7_9HYPO|nr:Peptidyl-tRNA hydrolase domain-containing protein [Tolypocladium capitatum]